MLHIKIFSYNKIKYGFKLKTRKKKTKKFTRKILKKSTKFFFNKINNFYIQAGHKHYEIIKLEKN